VVPQLSAERGHLRSPRDPVPGLPTVRGLEFLLGGSVSHVEIVGSRRYGQHA
jgi:hypothetical protein